MKDAHKAINEGFSTLEELLCESDRDFEETDGYIENFRMMILTNRYTEHVIAIGDLEKAEKVHPYTYDTDNGIPEKAYSAPIITIKRPSDGRTIIIDGNHKFNTFYNQDPSQEVSVLEFEFDFPDDIFVWRESF